MSTAVHTREAVRATAEHLHPELKDIPSKDMIKLEAFTWIDD